MSEVVKGPVRSPLSKLDRRLRVAVIAAMATGAVTAIRTARRDLASRATHEIRGNPQVWKRLTILPGPAIAYLLCGRRRTTATESTLH